MSDTRSDLKLYSKERESDLKSLKNSSIAIKLRYESTYKKQLDIRLIPIFQILKFNDHHSREFWNSAQVYRDIKPIWEVYLSMTAYFYLISIEFTLDIFGFIVDIMKGRFEIISVGEYFIEIKPYISTHIKLKSWIILEKSPSVRPIIAIVYFEDGKKSIEESFDVLMEEFYSFGYNVEKINNWENPLTSLVEKRENIYYPRNIDCDFLDANCLNTIDLKFKSTDTRKNKFSVSDYHFQDNVPDNIIEIQTKLDERDNQKIDE